jgi:hypothetical protein
MVAKNLPWLNSSALIVAKLVYINYEIKVLSRTILLAGILLAGTIF